MAGQMKAFWDATGEQVHTPGYGAVSQFVSQLAQWCCKPRGGCPQRASGGAASLFGGCISMRPTRRHDSCSAVCPLNASPLSSALPRRAGSHWQKGTLVGKPGAMFTSTATQGGEATALLCARVWPGSVLHLHS